MISSAIRLKNLVSNYWENILDFFFPELCVVCGVRLQETEKHLCLACIHSLPRTQYHNQEENRLEEFLGGKFIFHRAAAFCYFYKEGTLQKIVHEFKYKNNSDLAYYMGVLYGSELKDSEFIKEIDFLVPVPLHPKRRKQRGYNQAEEICRGISEITGVPVCATIVERVVNNPSQTKRSRNERWENTQGIFASTKNAELKEKSILLIDDIITTGSTLEAIAKSFSDEVRPVVNIAAIGIAM